MTFSSPWWPLKKTFFRYSSKFLSLTISNTYRILWLKCFYKIIYSLNQWFSTGVPRNTIVPWDSVRGASSYYFLLTFRPILASRGAAKYWYGRPWVPPQGKTSWETLFWTVFLNWCATKHKSVVSCYQVFHQKFKSSCFWWFFGNYCY